MMQNLETDNKLIILFDGICNMCIYSVQFIIKRDYKDVFRFASIQSDVGKDIIKNYNIDISKNDSIILISNHAIKYKSSAILSVLSQLHTIWRFLIIFYIVPYPIRDLLYSFLANIRYFLFGKQDKCMVPDDNINTKFLSL